MKHRDGMLLLSASDLVGWLGCQHLAGLEVEVACGTRPRPRPWDDPALALLQERGLAHERRYVEWLAAAEVVEIPVGDDGAEAATVDAMNRGAGAIVQASLASGRWFGRADLLRRVERPSRLGAWSYEVVDTKLAGETQARTVLQLCLYSDLIGELQGALPEAFHVVMPAPTTAATPFRHEQHRLVDYMAYYRLVKRRLEGAVPPSLVRAALTAGAGTYPDPNQHCDVCRWWSGCDAQRRADDSVWLVAGVGRAERRELDRHGVATLAGLAGHGDRFEPERVSRERLVRVRDQARVQLAGRTQARPVHERLPVEEGRGLARLPAPSPGDLFLDLEGDRWGIAEGREFLFGVAWAGDSGIEYRCRWATDDREEQAAFEWLVDEILARWERDPDLHVYHYAPYEPAALKRLMGRHGSREDAIDRMLRAELFVDLCAVVRQSTRASVESYSLKELERFTGFERTGELRTAGQAVRAVQLALGRGAPEAVDDQLRAQVEAYNRDDCASALRLREWLEGERTALEAAGETVPRPEPPGDGAAPDALGERLARVRAVADALAADLPADPDQRSDAERGRWLLSRILDYHRREEKVAWWEFFRLRELAPDELIDERAGLGGLEHVGAVGESPTGLPIHRYRFPEQESDVKVGTKVRACLDGDEVGAVVALDRSRRTIDIQKRRARQDQHPGAVFRHEVIRGPMDDSLLRLGEHILQTGGRTDECPSPAPSSPAAVEESRQPIAASSGASARATTAPGEDASRGSSVEELSAALVAALGMPSSARPSAGKARPRSPSSAAPGGTAAAGVRLRALSNAARRGDSRGTIGAQERPARSAAALALLRREPPALDLAARSAESMVDRACRLAIDLDGAVLPIQGPPGAGKTYTAARMIATLVAAGRKVGVTAVSHKVIRHLLDEVCAAAREAGQSIACLHKSDGQTAGREAAVEETADNGAVQAALASGAAQVVGGTAWLWSRAELEGAVDVLFVDEAGQMALANVLAVAPAGRSLVLVGDPQQLEQPHKGSHPGGADVSALEHLLGGRATVPPDRGLFLAETWRLAPALCRFTSEQFYEGRLQPRSGLERQQLVGASPVAGAGLFFAPAEHRGNQNASVEEVAVVERLVDALLADGSWIDARGARRPLAPGDVLVIAPYNAQVDLLHERLADRGVRVGTVDKFQGQEAPVVIFSTATSTPEDAPRGMEFLYCPRRFNVATSRARCAVVLVGSPRLFEPDCRTVRQVQLASGFCRFLEEARAVDLDPARPTRRVPPARFGTRRAARAAVRR
ncbi:MAG TPA: TM0106 family RecB-like putative nuclease [Kofleriaceae bacterium]|nr:TM0106 family RecB-like putative nuclease [Kofleriaceae bacterium]